MAADSTMVSPKVEELTVRSHCPQPSEAAQETVLCHSEDSMAAAADCCAMTVVAENGEVAVLALAFSLVLDLQAVNLMAAPAAGSHDYEGRWRQPSPQPAQPLFTLHSVFLI